MEEVKEFAAGSRRTFGVSKLLKDNPYAGCKERSLLGFLRIAVWETGSGKRSVGRGNHGLIRGQRSAGCSSLVERILIDCDTRKEILGFKEEAVLSYQRVRVC